MAKTVLVINSGSSSIKYQLVDLESGEGLASGLVEKIGEPVDGHYKHEYNGEKHELEEPIHDHEQGLKRVLGFFEEYGPNLSEAGIVAVGHRVVQGGSIFPKPALVTNKTINQVKDLAVLAPLHNGPEAKGAEVMRSLLPDVPQIFVFDSSFFFQLPKAASTYALNKEIADQYHIRRYGAHGTSHQFVAKKGAEMVGLDLNNSRIITCHIGNGSSITAIVNGKSIDTSMGLTPLEGLVMGTRCGDVDANAVLYMMKKENLTPDQMYDIVNKKSGFLGVSQKTSDARELDELANNGDRQAKLVLKMLTFQMIKYIGAYTAEMNGVDAIFFTGGIGEHNSRLRRRVCENFTYLGLAFDYEANTAWGVDTVISLPDSKVKVALVTTDEELVIARDTMHLVQSMDE